MREGQPTKNDLIEINKHVVNDSTKLPVDIKYGVRQNKLQDSIHCKIFEQYISKQDIDENGKVKDCIIILCDGLKV